jgi:hypothetical protein
MTYSKFVTNTGTSGSGKSYRFAIYIRSTGEYIGSAYTVDGGDNWFIRGLFREVARSFSNSQEAIEQATFMYEQEHSALSDAELMATF